MRPLLRQERRRRGARIAAMVGLGLLAGCAEQRAWHWDAATGPTPTGAAWSAPGPARAGTGAADPGVMVFGGPAFRADDPAEATRRDAVVSARRDDAMPGRLAWPEEARPDLRHTRSVRTSRTPERFVFPERRRDPPRRNPYHHHGW